MSCPKCPKPCRHAVCHGGPACGAGLPMRVEEMGRAQVERCALVYGGGWLAILAQWPLWNGYDPS